MDDIASFRLIADPARPADRRVQRFETLDAMRGVAALAVMAFHFLWSSRISLFGQAYLGVDFFFCLSGVILAHSYECKILTGMSFAHYMRKRLIRLYPFYLIGFLLGTGLLAIYWVRHRDIGFNPADYSLSIAAGAVALPYPNLGRLPFVGASAIPAPIFPTNIPAWSLFFELVASVALYTVARYRPPLNRLVVISGALWLAAVWFYGTANIGWGAENFLGGFPRTAFMFFLGMAIYRRLHKRPLAISLPRWCLLAALAALLAAPPLFHAHSLRIAQVVVLTLLLPAGVALGLSLDERGSRPGWFFVYLGRMSYGIYAIHWPLYHLLALALGGFAAIRWIVDAPVLFACIASIVVLVSAHLLTVYVDEPVRAWFAAHRPRREASTVTA